MIRPLVSYPEILELPNLSCFVRLPGTYPVTKLKLNYQKRNIITEGLQVRSITKSAKRVSEYMD